MLAVIKTFPLTEKIAAIHRQERESERRVMSACTGSYITTLYAQECKTKVVYICKKTLCGPAILVLMLFRFTVLLLNFVVLYFLMIDLLQ